MKLLRSDCWASTNVPLSGRIGHEAGIALHLAGYLGWVRNLARKPAKFYDRVFFGGSGAAGSPLGEQNIRGFERGEVGPRSAPEGGNVESG